MPPDYKGNGPPSQYFSDHNIWFVINFNSIVMGFVIFRSICSISLIVISTGGFHQGEVKDFLRNPQTFDEKMVIFSKNIAHSFGPEYKEGKIRKV